MNTVIKLFIGIILIIIVFMAMILLQIIINELDHKKKLYELERDRYERETNELFKPNILESLIGYRTSSNKYDNYKNNLDSINEFDLDELPEEE